MSLEKYQPNIKICGIKTSQMLQTTIDAGADMVGFVFFEKSPRHIELAQISKLISLSKDKIETVVLTVNPSDELVKQIDALKPDWLQLHGNESVERVKQIKRLTNMKIIKALPIGSGEDIDKIDKFYRVAERLILDAKPPPNATRPGGLGFTFDWALLKKLDKSIKFMLSGGLNDKNIDQAMQEVHPFGFDVSSGVESQKGIKDKKKIINFVKNAKLAAKK